MPNVYVKDAVARPNTNYALVLGPELADVVSKVQSVMTSMGTYIQQVLHEMCSPYQMTTDEIDSFLGAGCGLARQTTFDVGYFTWDDFTKTKFYDMVGFADFRLGDGRKLSRPDYFLVANTRVGAYLIIVEQKVGAKYNTKSINAEKSALMAMYAMFAPYTSHLHVCPVIATTSVADDQQIISGFNYLPMNEIVNGQVSVVRNKFLFEEVLGIKYVAEDKLEEVRAANAQYVTSEVVRVLVDNLMDEPSKDWV